MKTAYFLGIILFFVPALVYAGVVINEVAWMGTSADPNGSYCEWIELFNEGGADIILDGWKLSIGSTERIFNTESEAILSIDSGGFYLIERYTPNACPDPVSSITADWSVSFGSGISNSGTVVTLNDASGNMIDQINALGGWPAGENDIEDDIKKTMQRTSSGAWITAEGTPRAVNPESDSPTENSSSAEASEENNSTTSSTSGFVPAYDDTPKITARATAEKTMVTGAEYVFSGEGFGLDGKPLSEAEYKWSFGDGSYKAGKNITHAYFLPGDYMAVLNVTSGMYGASDYLKVKVIPLPIYISEIKPGRGGFVELYNTSKYNLNISGFAINNSKSSFYLPENTIIIAASRLALSQEVMNLEIESLGTVFFLYQNASPADSISYSEALKDNESFHKIEDEVKIGISSPGDGSFVATKIIIAEAPAQNTDGIKKEQQSSEQVLSASSAENIEDSFEKQTQTAIANEASRRDSGNFFESVWFWFSGAAILGILSAAGVIVLRKNKDFTVVEE